MIRERISVSFVKLFLCKITRIGVFLLPLSVSCSPHLSVYPARLCDTRKRQIQFSELLRWEVPGVRVEWDEKRASTE